MNSNEIKRFSRWLGKQLLEITSIALIAFFIAHYIAQPIIVEGSSMYPTLKDKNFGISSRLFGDDDIKRFDIVCIDMGNKKIIKRVIGLPGEDIRYTNNQLYVNGEAYEEDFLEDSVNTTDFMIHVPDGAYFCLGDNREHSTDSRYYGAFDRSQIFTKDVFLLVPLKGVIN